jgi:hypothetical protein
MARYANDGMIKVTWAPSVASKAAPTVAELDAGVDIECHLTKDGLGVTNNENTVDDGSLCEVFDRQLPGSYSTSMALTMKRNNVALSDPWTFFARGDEGYLVVRRGVAAATAWTAAQNVEVYPAVAGQKSPAPTASNEQGRMTINFYGTEEPSLDAVVA